MVISPTKKDLSTILNLLGRLILGLSFFMLVPLFVAVAMAESSPFFDFVIGVSLSGAFGLILLIFFPIKNEISWIHTFFTVSLGWLFFSLLGAIPLFLSGHFGSFLDACFEAMSGFATTGLILIQDLDHLSFSHNTWRHLTMFIGGQGIILASLSILSQAKSVAVGFYLGEARQEKIFPNVMGTARFIWKVSFIFLITGVAAYSLILSKIGLPILKSVFQAFWLFFAAFDTGGFTPYKQSIAYYHSFQLEIATIVFMILGAFNFNLHFWLWHKEKKEIFKNFEIKTFLFTFFSLLLLIYLPFLGTNFTGLFRGGFYQLISAHTGCGFTNLEGGVLMGFPLLSILAVIFAMMIGGGVCSTTGGIKLMRIGIIFKTIFAEVKRWIMPPNAVFKEKYHHLNNLLLSNKRIKDAFVIFILFIITYVAGALIAIGLGYPGIAALFESVSATANVGLSSGITSPDMPNLLKVVYIVQMWVGRLEFIAVFVTLGVLLSFFKK
ncbi:MAG: TrkH family potassium uptake protein [Candidatus Omnitrophica bacterium]|nr:TrkH family potassium uptake protein [Candidatus Omnitrophota bacterium]MCF7891920.1 TrkH family potassium uptake protein [Candidatus Omnitrophota bacterium]MCF7896054.1 TrkH family potassium uptake protein [Candidatus Omnitrophota bacterium]MCF7897461.1 TrkH family potassium uptake protein [Candidatus Omnitrophota bacterium]MCF7909361.1 TrkH family potassium uptake protein [Candidatus Omnitrophota bacterium]